MPVAAALMMHAGQAQAQMSTTSLAGVIKITFDLPQDDRFRLHSTGDFNQDGHLDLLLTGQNAWIMLGNDEGGFDPYGPFIGVPDFDLVQAGQFDQDPEPEIAFGLPQFGYGVAYEPDTQPVEVPDQFVDYNDMIGEPRDDEFTRTMRSADLDEDGVDELIFNTRDSRLYIDWSQAGDATEFPVPGLGQQNALYEPADYDGDGDQDLLLYDRATAQFMLIEGMGASGLGAVRVVDGEYPRIVFNDRPVFGQLDDNPAMDMIVCNSLQSTISIVYNFVLPNPMSEPLEIGAYARPIEIVPDIDGSGLPDLIVRQLEFGDFGYYLPKLVTDPAGPAPALLDLDIGEINSFPYNPPAFFSEEDVLLDQVTAVDLDQDGDRDLLWHFYSDIGFNGFTPSQSIWAVENRMGEPGVPLLGANSIRIVSEAQHVLALDTDLDGRDEFVVSRAGGANMRIWDPDSSVLGRVLNSEDAFMSLAADLDQDGTPELISASRISGGLRIFELEGDNFISNRTVIDPPFGSGRYAGLETGDFNADGYPDVIAMGSTGGAPHIYLGGEDPKLTFWAEVSSPGLIGNKLGVLDFNADGYADLVIGSDEAELNVSLYQNNTDGTFTVTSPTIPRLPRISGLTPYWITTGDVDLDGITDIVYSVASDRLSLVLFLNDEAEVSEVAVLSAHAALEVLIEDISGDGLPDIVLAGDRLSVIPQSAPRSFGPAVQLPGYTVTGATIGQVGDDETREIVSVSSSEYRLRVHSFVSGSCPADLNRDGEINFFDVSHFVQTLPDYNSDGAFDFYDVSAFITDYLAGCP
jgi:hypothetical protein